MRQAPGYRLDVAPETVDRHHFDLAADAARAAVQAYDWTAAIAAAETALAYWRGGLLADLGDEEWVRLAAVGLDERRAECTEDLVTGLLGANSAGPAVTSARALYAAQPLRERACWLYVLALHRDGRTTEALDVYRAHVGRLDDELGLEPGPALRDLQGAILRQDVELLTWPNVGAVPSPPIVEPAGEPTPRPAAPADACDTHAGFVGRARELDAVDEIIDEAAAGSVRWIVLTGPAGIGKTRLAEEAMARAAARGARLVRTGCPDDDGVPPWWPVSQLVRALGGDPDAVLTQDPTADADRARFAVYERVRSLLTAAADTGPLVVLVDDVQWADPSSLGLLAHLTFALDARPVTMLLTARDGVTNSDLRRLFDATARVDGARTIQVPPLSHREVGDLVRRVSGGAVDDDEASLLSARTGGNPFFVSEYARLPKDEREAGSVPLAVRSVLGRRLDALDADTLQVLRVAAVIGDTLDIALLRAVSRLDADELADLLDEAADERIVVVAPGSRHYAFAHGLLRDEVLAGMSDARRQRLHSRVAAAIEPGGPTDDLVRRAGHLVAAMPLVEADEVFDACRSAAQDADANGHTDSAAHWWEAALTVYDQLPAQRRVADERDLLVRQQLGALIRAGRGQTVYELVGTEIETSLRERQPHLAGMRARALMRSTGAWPWAAFGENAGPLLSILQRAEPQVADEPSAHARVLGALAIGSCYDPDGRVPDELSRRAIEIAERTGDPDVIADTLLARALTFSGVAERAHESIRLLERLSTIPHDFGAVDEVIRHGLLTMACATVGDLAATAEHTRLGIAGSDELRLPVSRLQFRLTESLMAVWRGEFALAQRLLDDGVRMREQTELYFGWASMATVLLRWKQGRLAEFVDDPAGDEDVERVCLAVAAGDLQAADVMITEILAQPRPVTWTSHGEWALLGTQVVDAGLAQHAPQLIELLTPLSGMLAIVGQLTVVGPVSLVLARLHLLLDDRDAARTELAAALELCERTGGVPSALRCRLLAFEIDGGSAADLAVLVADAEAAGVHGVVRDARALATPSLSA